MAMFDVLMAFIVVGAVACAFAGWIMLSLSAPSRRAERGETRFSSKQPGEPQ
jgi:hypothetical protein